MKTHGQCKWAKPIPGNPNEMVCMGGRPQVIVVPQKMPNGQTAVTVQTVYPNVMARDEAPGCFEAGKYGVEDTPRNMATGEAMDVTEFLRSRLANHPDSPKSE